MKGTRKYRRGCGADIPTSTRNFIAQLIRFARQNAPLPLYYVEPNGTGLWAFLYINTAEETVGLGFAPTTEMCDHVRDGTVLRIILPALIDSECLAGWLQSVATQRLLGDIMAGSSLVPEGDYYVCSSTVRARMAQLELAQQGGNLSVTWKVRTVAHWLERADIMRLFNGKRTSGEIAKIVQAKADKHRVHLIDGDELYSIIEDLCTTAAEHGETIQ
jgi:hypothetical protein